MEEIVANEDEAQVPEYTLPDPLTLEDGSPVSTAAEWHDLRRPELLTLFEHFVYGRAPGRPETLLIETTTVDGALEGLATRKEITLRFSGTPQDPAPQQALRLLLYLPLRREAPVPVFVGLNFQGNHTVQPDPEIMLAALAGMRAQDTTRSEAERVQEMEAARGAAASRWPVSMILRRGYGVATMFCGDVDPDFHDGFENGVHGLFPRDDSRGDAWATLSAWAWGLSRALDAFETDPDVDAARVSVIGHSRLGKAALWAGATDPRFALVVSNNSGCGGAALSRRRFGETVRRINTVFPHWFCTNFKAFNDNEDALPVDQHELLALIAPRPVYVASAAEDLWADPRGEYLSARAASPVYELVAGAGLPGAEMPAVDTPVHGRIGYHVRTGGHNVTAYDWEQYLTFADMHLGSGR
jgi:hypothetical protein